MAETLDIYQLASTLDISNKNDVQSQLNENREKTEKYKTLPKYGPLLLAISCNNENKFSEEVSHNASVQLKNYINSNWKYGNDPEINKTLCLDNQQIIVISDEDKNFIRNNILEAVIYIVERENIKILRCFNQCVKKILKLDYNSIWKNTYVDYIIKCFNSDNQKRIYAGIMLLYQLSKLYQYEDEEKQKDYNEVLIKITNRIIFFMKECKKLNNNVEAMVLYKLIKIFFKSFQVNTPELLKTPDVFNEYSEIITHIIKYPLNQQYIEDKKNIFWKLKDLCFQILTRIVQKNTNCSIKEKNDFQKLIEEKYIKIYLEIFVVIYKNYNNNQCYVDDYGKANIYIFFSYLLEKKNLKIILYNYL